MAIGILPLGILRSALATGTIPPPSVVEGPAGAAIELEGGIGNIELEGGIGDIELQG